MPDSQVASAYAVAGVASLLTWLVVSYVALSFHPVPSINAACGLRHNALTMAQVRTLVFRDALGPWDPAG